MKNNEMKNEIQDSWNRVTVYLGFLSSPWTRSCEETVRSTRLRKTFMRQAGNAVLSGLGYDVPETGATSRSSVHKCPDYFKKFVALLDRTIMEHHRPMR